MLSKSQIREAILIRTVEESFLKLFSEGKLNGTVHTSVGQELSAVAFAGQLNNDDFVFSNHRCHGHYISFTKDYYGLIAELLGKKNGVCGGIGSSQHLQNGNFYSNGIQGGIVPIAAGMALANKLENNDKIGIVFIGDGTLGEGVVYETLNLISLWQLPLLVVCENNFYAQSTSSADNIAGDILKRAEAFGIKTFKSETWDEDKILIDSKNSIDYVRKTKKPVFHLVDTYRLNAHSKGDDNRDVDEINRYREKDFIYRFKMNNPELYGEITTDLDNVVKEAIDDILLKDELTLEEYYLNNADLSFTKWDNVVATKERQVTLINRFFHDTLHENPKAIFIGEDVLSPYGGAFKVAKDLSSTYPNQVFTTPISEAGITGIANGLAISGFKPYLEIMFGDFMTLILDQIINHSSKFYHMYNHKVNCPLVVRTPMGGRRGYGPTHSQTLDRFLIGIDNVKVVALNTMIDPSIIYSQVNKEVNPVIVIENKVDYGKYVGDFDLPNFVAQYNNSIYPVIKISPILSKPNLTIVTYGGMLNEIISCLNNLFVDHEYIVEVITLTKINPIDYKEIIESLEITKRLVVVEEGSKIGGFSSEVISSVLEIIPFKIEVLKIGALPIPIPSVRSLEDEVIPGKNSINQIINNKFK